MESKSKKNFYDSNLGHKKIGKDYMKQSQKHFKILINEIKKK